jgi:hypothetical protein
MFKNSERDKGNDEKQINVKQTVKQYYGEALQNTSDLKTNACTDVVPPSLTLSKGFTFLMWVVVREETVILCQSLLVKTVLFLALI